MHSAISLTGAQLSVTAENPMIEEQLYAIEKERSKTDRGNDLIVTLTAIAPLMAIYLYFLGISYLYSLAYYLGFSLGSVEIPINYTFVYSYGALIHFSLWNIILWVLLSIIIALAVLFDRRSRFIQIILLVIVVLLFPVSSRVAKSYAHERAVQVTWHPEKMVFFTFKDKTSIPTDLQKKASEGDGLILVMETADKIIAMDRIASEGDESALNSLYIIRLKDLSSARISFMGVSQE